MRTPVLALVLMACGTSQDLQDASATTDAPADVATESAVTDAQGDGSATLGPPRVYIGASDGIHVCSFDTQTYALSPIDVTTVSGGNPSFLAIDSARAFLYAADETNSQVLAFSIDKTTGKLTSIGKVSSLGSGPAHVALDRKDSLVMVANYGGGTIAVYPRAANGTLADASATYSFGATSHSHEILTDPSNAFVVVPNLGLNGVGVFSLDAGALSYLGLTQAGNGARHMAFNSTGTHAWVVDETASTITAFVFDGSGTLGQNQQLSSLYGTNPASNTGAEIAVTNDDMHVLVSNRGDDSIVVFDIDGDGQLSPTARVSTNGKTPRHFSIDQTGRFLFVGNQTSNTVVTMTMNAQSGVPSPVGTPLNVTGPEFVALVYLP